MTLVYFTDRDLGLRFPEILKNAGLTVERHRDHFRHDAADEDWLAEIGRRGWVALMIVISSSESKAFSPRKYRFRTRRPLP